ncbi:antitoxin VapB family protein [Halomontanus rarus]|uniref:antitoxin VapB family protein n=1 Tax=Halomontanus rarus TaxID=3034020 RepID=UPI001A9A0292
MGTKTITITEDAYDRLKAYKRSDESFTETILRITGDERDVMKGFGSWEGTGLREEVDEHREEVDRELEETVDELS